MLPKWPLDAIQEILRIDPWADLRSHEQCMEIRWAALTRRTKRSRKPIVAIKNPRELVVKLLVAGDSRRVVFLLVDKFCLREESYGDQRS